MFEKYLATKKDLEAIEQGIDWVWRKELDFIFKDRSKIAKTLVISYDSKKLYVWERKRNKYFLHKIPHSLKIEDKYQWFWRAGLQPKELYQFFPEKWRKDWFERFKISGGLLTPFTSLQKSFQKKSKPSLNPYITYESYLATIVHEFGHIYYHQYRNKKAKNSKLLNTALNLYQRKKVGLNINLYSFLPHATDVFAFCVDYTAASIFWPSHKKDIEKSNIKRISRIINQKNNAWIEWSPHTFADIAGKIILTKYPQDWPDRILQNRI